MRTASSRLETLKEIIEEALELVGEDAEVNIAERHQNAACFKTN